MQAFINSCCSLILLFTLKTEEGFSLQMHRPALILSQLTYTTILASLLDHDRPTAEGLSCDFTYQSDS